MPKATLIAGLPGSGKSTWTQRVISASDERTMYVNRDTVRRLLGYEAPGDQRSNETDVTALCKEMTRLGWKQNRHVYIDNVHGQITREKRYYEDFGFEVETVLIFTPLEICIQRQEQRDRKVPADVITSFYDRFAIFRDLEIARIAFDRVIVHAEAL